MNEAQIRRIIHVLRQKFATVDLRDIKFLLGIGIERDVHAGTIRRTQASNARTILEICNIVGPTKTYAEVSSILICKEEILTPEVT